LTARKPLGHRATVIEEEDDEEDSEDMKAIIKSKNELKMIKR
jgi:hypothetical protein